MTRLGSRPRAALSGAWLDIVLALTIFLIATAAGTSYWRAFVRQGGAPEFYQIYFEPSVMIACGKGFGVSVSQPKPLEDFLWRRRDALSCSELPVGVQLGGRVYQGAWFYLLQSVGWWWRVAGVSWSGMAPFFGLLFGSTVAVSFAVFRLGMGRVLAAAGAFALCTSSLHLSNLPHLRDYAKAPFMVGLILLLGVLVTRPPGRSTVLLAGAYGAVLAIGYGFRTDFLVNLPVVVIVLFAFLPGGLRKHLSLKLAATAVFVVTFFVLSSPVRASVSDQGGCQWHVALLGLQTQFETALGVTPAPYDFGYAYADGFVIRNVQGFAKRINAAAPPPLYCSPEYDAASGGYLWEIVHRFPADMVVRAYASIVQVVDLPRQGFAAPGIRWADRLMTLRKDFQPAESWFAAAVAVSVLGIAAADLRLGLFVMFFVAYFGGYPAVQFQERHYFYLELIGWFAAGLLVHHAVGLLRRQPLSFVVAGGLRNVAVVTAVTAAVFGGTLIATRWYQTGEARRLFDGYLSASRQRWTVAPPGDTAPALLLVEVDAMACGPSATLTFEYQPGSPEHDFTRRIVLSDLGSGGVTSVTFPAFANFAGVRVSDTSDGCTVSVYQLSDGERFPLWLHATLPPGWQSRPLYQRLELGAGDD